MARAAIRTIGVALLTVVGLAAVISAPEARQPRERVLYVNVFDEDSHKPVPGLGPADFVVREDGVQREVLRVTPATSPMPVAILIDNSQPAESAIADMRRALTAFINEIQGIGPIALISVAGRPTILVDYTTTTKSLLSGVGRVFAVPGTGATLLDAIRETSAGIRKREADRAALVVLTTENVEFSTLHYTQVLEALRDSGAAMHAVVLTNPRGSLTSEEARNRATVLDRGTRDTGGVRIDVLSSISFESQMRDLAAILKSQYRVVYARPESLIPPERLEISMKNSDLEARGAPARGQSAK